MEKLYGTDDQYSENDNSKVQINEFKRSRATQILPGDMSELPQMQLGKDKNFFTKFTKLDHLHKTKHQ